MEAEKIARSQRPKKGHRFLKFLYFPINTLRVGYNISEIYFLERGNI